MTSKQLTIEIKEFSEEGSFEGLLSPYGTVDLGGDMVEPGAYVKTIQENKGKVVMLWQHQTASPIGELTLEDRADGLWCKGKLCLELAAAKEAYISIKAGLVKGLSIGYDSIKDSVENGIRHLKEIRLWEGSLVTFPMAPSAMIASFKAGAMLSAANKSRLSTAHEHAKSIHEILTALLEPEAGADEDTTSGEKAAAEKTEPVNHSEVEAQIEHMKGLFKWN